VSYKKQYSLEVENFHILEKNIGTHRCPYFWENGTLVFLNTPSTSWIGNRDI
jgi:hypothetical protein